MMWTNVKCNFLDNWRVECITATSSLLINFLNFLRPKIYLELRFGVKSPASGTSFQIKIRTVDNA
jgi:hypothetical protein